MRLDRKFKACTQFLSRLKRETNYNLKRQEMTTPVGAQRKTPEEVRLSALKPPPPPAKKLRIPAKNRGGGGVVAVKLLARECICTRIFTKI